MIIWLGKYAYVYVTLITLLKFSDLQWTLTRALWNEPCAKNLNTFRFGCTVWSVKYTSSRNLWNVSRCRMFKNYILSPRGSSILKYVRFPVNRDSGGFYSRTHLIAYETSQKTPETHALIMSLWRLDDWCSLLFERILWRESYLGNYDKIKSQC